VRDKVILITVALLGIIAAIMAYGVYETMLGMQ